jgi:hypothetical protein
MWPRQRGRKLQIDRTTGAVIGKETDTDDDNDDDN